MANYNGQKRNLFFRELVAARLGLSGLDASAAPLRAPRTLSAAMADETVPQPDIVLSGFYTKVSAAISADRLGPALDSAALNADLLGGGAIPLVVSHRRGRGVADSMVSLKLVDFAKLAGQLAEVDQ